MGQRTATLVSYTDEQGVKHNKGYHNQWGIGRVQLNALMGNFLAQLGEPKFDLSGTKKMYDESNCIPTVDNLDFSNIEDVKMAAERFDNNNGGVVMIVDDSTADGNIKIGFFLGEEECYNTDDKPFSRFVTFEEWAEKVGGQYVDENYKQMFHYFCKHFNITILS